MMLRTISSANGIVAAIVAMLLIASAGQCQSPLVVAAAKLMKANTDRPVSLPSNELRLRALEDHQFLSGMAHAVLFNTTAESMAIYQQYGSPKNVHAQNALLLDGIYYHPVQLSDDAAQTLRKHVCDYLSFRTCPRLLRTIRTEAGCLLIVFTNNQRTLKIVLDLGNAEATFYDGRRSFKAEIESSAAQQIRTLLASGS